MILRFVSEAGHSLAHAVAMALQDLERAYGRVKRDADGVPVEWRIFGYGPIAVAQNGVTFEGEFTPEAASAIMDYHRRKGQKIPLDSKHFTFHLANRMGVEEADIARLLHTDRVTFGFIALEARADGLYAVDAEYHPLGRRLMAEGVLRWYSPVLRGLSDGRLRLTSMTFTNEPAANGIETIAAEAETAPLAGDIDTLAASLDSLAESAKASTKPKETETVKKLLETIAKLLGRDAVALEDGGEAPADVLEAVGGLAAELPGLRAAAAARAKFIGAVKDALALEGEPDLDTVAGAVLGLVEKAKAADTLQQRVDALALEAEGKKKSDLIARGEAEGKLTKAMIDGWAKDLDCAALEAYLAHAPRIVPVGEKLDHGKLPGAGDAVALTAEEKDICRDCGISEEQFLATKKQLAAA